MKIAHFIIGIIIGSFFTTTLKPSPAFAEGKNLNSNGSIPTSTRIVIDQIKDPVLEIVSLKHPNMSIFIDISDGDFFEISLRDQSGASAGFNDKNSDGIWDFRYFENNDVMYLYGRGTGYPDTIMSSSNSLIRIDGKYYEAEGEPSEKYIMMDGQKIAVQPDEGGRGYFTLK